MKSKITIEAEKLYSLFEIRRLGVLPVITHRSTLKRVLEDMALPKTEQTLKPQKVGEGVATRYFIKGKNLIQYLEKYGEKNHSTVEGAKSKRR